jgi:hypothetical protein
LTYRKFKNAQIFESKQSERSDPCITGLTETVRVDFEKKNQTTEISFLEFVSL